MTTLPSRYGVPPSLTQGRLVERKSKFNIFLFAVGAFFTFEKGIGKKDAEWTNLAKVVCGYYEGECLFIAKRIQKKRKAFKGFLQ